MNGRSKLLLVPLVMAAMCFLSSSTMAVATDKDCGDFEFQEEAQEYFESIGGSRFNDADLLDSDHDGIACELLPSRGYVAESKPENAPVPSPLPQNDTEYGNWGIVAGAALAVSAGAFFLKRRSQQTHPVSLSVPSFNRSSERRSQLKSMPYQAYLQTPEWKETRIAALKRAKHRCQLCNHAGSLEVHHRTYERRGNEANEDLIVLCRGCHGKFHDRVHN